MSPKRILERVLNFGSCKRHKKMLFLVVQKNLDKFSLAAYCCTVEQQGTTIFFKEGTKLCQEKRLKLHYLKAKVGIVGV